MLQYRNDFEPPHEKRDLTVFQLNAALGLATFFCGDYEIFSMVILPFRRFKKGCCQFLEEECTQVLVNRFNRGLSLPKKNVVW